MSEHLDQFYLVEKALTRKNECYLFSCIFLMMSVMISSPETPWFWLSPGAEVFLHCIALSGCAIIHSVDLDVQHPLKRNAWVLSQNLRPKHRKGVRPTTNGQPQIETNMVSWSTGIFWTIRSLTAHVYLQPFTIYRLKHYNKQSKKCDLYQFVVVKHHS